VTRTEALIALNMIAHVGPVRVRKLLEVFGEPQGILQAKAAELSRVEGLPRNTIDALLNWEKELDLPAELERVRQFGATVITQDDPIYSALLRQIYDPPLVL
jgi:DNA processing protein